MTNAEDKLRESISALVDGQALGEDFARVVANLEASDQARRDWDSYHLVGEVMRFGERAAVQVGDAKFLTAIRSKLQEDVALAVAGLAVQKTTLGRESANQDNFYWKLTAGLASFVAVAVLGWQMVASSGQPSAAPQLAKVESSSSAAVAQVMIRDPQLDKLLEAHQLNAGISALQLPAGFMRNATYDKSAR